MDLYLQLTEALYILKGGAMERVMREAVVAGLTPREALKVLSRMYDEAAEKNDEIAQEIIGDYGCIANGHCQPQYRIWPVEETLAHCAISKSFWDDEAQ